MIETPNPKPMSFEQAVNFIKTRRKTAKEDAKVSASKAQISLALEPDRRRYLTYCVSFLDTVSSEVERAFLKVSGSISSSITRKDIAFLLKKILMLRINNYSVAQIARALDESPIVISRCEQLAMIAVGDAIERHKINGIPLVGG